MIEAILLLQRNLQSIDREIAIEDRKIVDDELSIIKAKENKDILLKTKQSMYAALERLQQ